MPTPVARQSAGPADWSQSNATGLSTDDRDDGTPAAKPQRGPRGLAGNSTTALVDGEASSGRRVTRAGPTKGEDADEHTAEQRSGDRGLEPEEARGTRGDGARRHPGHRRRDLRAAGRGGGGGRRGLVGDAGRGRGLPVPARGSRRGDQPPRGQRGGPRGLPAHSPG